MKKLVSIFLILMLLFTACGKKEPVVVYADYLQQELVPSTEGMEIMEILCLSEEYDLFIRNDNEYSQYVVFSSDTNVKNFAFFTIAIPEGDKIEYNAEKPVLHYDKITAHKNLVIKMDMPETLPWYGISYTDENGDTVKYAILVSGKDGSVILNKFAWNNTG